MKAWRRALVRRDRLSYHHAAGVNNKATQYLLCRSIAHSTNWGSTVGCCLISPRCRQSVATKLSDCKSSSTAAASIDNSYAKLPATEVHQHVIERTKSVERSEWQEVAQVSDRLNASAWPSPPTGEQQSKDAGLETLNLDEPTRDDWKEAFSILCKYYNPNSGARAAYRHHYSHRRSRLERQSWFPREPGAWGCRSLTVYIHDLAEYKPPRSILCQFLPSEAKHPQVKSIWDLANVILSVLQDENLRDSVNIEACHVALRFFYRYRFMLHARALYRRMEYLKMGVSTKTWNIILEASAIRKDLANFTGLLQAMIRRGFRPDANTWIAFTRVLDTADTGSLVIRKMRSLGVMNNTNIQRDTSGYMVGYHIEEHMQEDGAIDIASLFSGMHGFYGPYWLSTSAGNTVLSKLIQSSKNSKSARISRALDVLAQMQEHNFIPNQKTMAIFLHGCEGSLRRDMLMQVLVTFQEKWKLGPDSQGHERLFRYAWSHKDLNFLRAIWISACVKGYVTFSMQDRIVQSVLQYSLLSLPDTQPIPFKALAGWFVLSIDPHKPITGINPDGHNPEGKDRQVSQALIALKSNLALVGQASIPPGFLTDLRQASVIDHGWYSKGFWTSRQTQDVLIKDSMRIRVAERSRAHAMKAGFRRVGLRRR